MNFNSCLIDMTKVKCMSDFLNKAQTEGACFANTKPETPTQRRARLKRELEQEEANEQANAEFRNNITVGLNMLRLPTYGTFQQLSATISQFMQHQGFWDSDNTAEKIALMHSELSEALEAHRKQIHSDDKIPDFDGVTAELADTVIRILDFAGHHRLRLGEAIIEKMLVNVQRPYKHGKLY